MCNQYKAHKIYFFYACIKYDVICYMTLPCRDEWKDFSYYKIHWRKGIRGLKFQFMFIHVSIFNKIHFYLYLFLKSYSLLQNV